MPRQPRVSIPKDPEQVADALRRHFTELQIAHIAGDLLSQVSDKVFIPWAQVKKELDL